MSDGARTHEGIAYATATIFGGLIAAADWAAPFGDDSSQFTVFLLLVSSAAMGFARPSRAWRWALVIGPATPLLHAALRILRLRDSINPNTLTTALVLLPIVVAVGLVGAYLGAGVRRLCAPPRAAVPAE
jgi:hypothetical protein